MSSCDESKCVSKGNSLAHNGSFTCYGDNFFYPKMCADGYLPAVVEDEPYIQVPDPNLGVVSLQYFTCCPPSQSNDELPSSNVTNSEIVARHCSDPITDSIDEDADHICKDKYVRPMNIDYVQKTTAFGAVVVPNEHSFLCCDEDTSDAAPTDYLDEMECVPYTNEVYESAMVFNLIGVIDAVHCDIPDFPVPRPIIEGTGGDFTGPIYQCCKSGTPLPPFVHDKAFKITVYTHMALSSVVVILSGIAALALLIPLFNQKKAAKDPMRSSTWRSGLMSVRDSVSVFSRKSVLGSSVEKGSSSKGMGSSTKRMSSQQRRNFESVRQSVRGRGGPRYSTYNLYLVYLVLADFLYFIVEIGLFGSNMNQVWNRRFYPGLVFTPSLTAQPFDNKISYPYLAANLWINAIICYQLVVLLQTSRRAQRISQPSVKRVNVQIGLIYLVVTICGVALHYLLEGMNEAGLNGDLDRQAVLLPFSYAILTLMMAPPFLYVVYAAILIWWRGYIPSLKGATPKAKAMRQLAFYFFRIIAVFIGVWFPVYVCLAMAIQFQEYWLLAVGYWLTAVQPILTFLVILTKSDTRKYIWDLISLSYLFDSCSRRRSGGDIEDSQAGDDENGMKNDLETSATGMASGVTASGATSSSILNTSGVISSSKFGLDNLVVDEESTENSDKNNCQDGDDEEDYSKDLVLSVLGGCQMNESDAQRNPIEG